MQKETQDLPGKKRCKSTISLSLKHKIMLVKLTQIHGLPKNKIIESLIKNESVKFNLVEARN